MIVVLKIWTLYNIFKTVLVKQHQKENWETRNIVVLRWIQEEKQEPSAEN